ncbi:DUF3772 domain-containing protein [Mangrovivirga cuniculi]|uniref:Uncharacterized protein n=1 Tax=Mangrovivirga cuniculi TaxID=2715131 RepID=A0A4D7JGI5_9BACT|nr:DUF3772 domain-containing protein [Mangrovivirga cuniculi]QCK14213.1 hypothetical protein DCC35_05365 [Mangrovivirga cuniculi]
MIRYASFFIITLFFNLTLLSQDEAISEIRSKIEESFDHINNIKSLIKSGPESKDSLTLYSNRLLDIQDGLVNEIDRLDEIEKDFENRLRELGPEPAEGEMPEAKVISKLRDSLETKISNTVELKQSAILLNEQISQLLVDIAKKKSDIFIDALGNRSKSILSPDLWVEASRDFPVVVDKIAHFFNQWADSLKKGKNYKATIMILMTAFILIVIVFYLVSKNSIWKRIDGYFEKGEELSLINRKRRAAVKSFSDLLLLTFAFILLYWIGKEFNLITVYNKLFFLRLFFGITASVFFIKYIRSAFSPSNDKWRIVNCNNEYARQIVLIGSAIFILFIFERIPTTAIELVHEIGEDLIHVISGSLGIVILVLIFMLTRKKIWINTIKDSSEEDSHGHLKIRYELLRKGFRFATIILILAILLGYIRFSAFMVDRFVLLSFFVAFVISLRHLMIWGIYSLQKGEEDTNHSDIDSEDQKGDSVYFWTRIIVDISLPFLILPLLLILLGFDKLNIQRIYSYFESDIHIGAVSFSVTNLLYGFLVFIIAIAVVRWISKMFERRILGSSHFDPGLRNSMMTLANYVGMLIAVILALSTIGIDFSKIALIAGALSVGIGFGLQSIVSNFVSGLILLFERPIKIGDWIVVNSGQGYVKHIGARATQVQTFDQSTIVIPNSELISNSLTNWFYNNRRGRVIVPVGVAYSSDPEKVKNILIEAASEHPAVLKIPPISVYWSDFADSSLNFEVRAFIKNYDDVLSVKTDIRFAIFSKFKKAGITIPFPQRDVNFFPQEDKESKNSSKITPHKRTKGTKGE